MFKTIIKAALVLATSISLSYAGTMTLPVHHGYAEHTVVSNEGLWNHDIHLTWNKEPKADQIGFYSMYAFWFQNQAQGYLGMQSDPEGKKAIFSIWDSGNRATTRPIADWCNRFGHEGAGTQCIIKFDWKAGREYKLRIWKIINTPTDQWGAWVIDYVTGEETLIGVIEVQNYGFLTGFSLSNIENYGGNPGQQYSCADVQNFSVTWKGPYYNNGKHGPTSVQKNIDTSVGASCKNQLAIRAAALHTTKMEYGADIKSSDYTGEQLLSRDNGQRYQQFDCTFNWLEQNFSGIVNQSLFRHSRLSKQFLEYYSRDYTEGGVGNKLMVNIASGKLLLTDSQDKINDLGPIDNWIKQSSCNR